MSQGNDGSPEFATAVAAAAAAIHSIEESNAPRRPSEGAETSLANNMSRWKDVAVGMISRQFSNVDKKTSGTSLTGEASMKNPEVRNHRMPEGWIEDQKMPKRAVSINKTPSFADSRQNSGGKRKPAPSPRTRDTKVDVWEKAEMTRINNRYERMNSTIHSWEKEKKEKAKRRMDKESRTENRRTKASQRYHNDMFKINEIVGEAKAIAEKKRRKAEMKIKEKANKMRLRGDVPVRCLCC